MIPASRGDDRIFDNELSDNPAGARAERQSDRDLLKPATRSDEHKASDVHASDEQHAEPRRPITDATSVVHPNKIVLQPDRHGMKADAREDEFGVWVSFKICGIQSIKLRLGFGHGAAGS